MLIAFCAVCLSTQLMAQNDLYRTDNGNMIINAVLNDSALVVRTKELIVILDYESAEFTVVLNRSKLYSGVDSIDQNLRQMSFDPIELKGQLDLDYINTKGHPPLDFKVEGRMSTNNEQILGSGHLEHLMEGTSYACLLSMIFHIELKTLGLDLNVAGLTEEVHIEILQTVLRKETD